MIHTWRGYVVLPKSRPRQNMAREEGKLATKLGYNFTVCPNGNEEEKELSCGHACLRKFTRRKPCSVVD